MQDHCSASWLRFSRSCRLSVPSCSTCIARTITRSRPIEGAADGVGESSRGLVGNSIDANAGDRAKLRGEGTSGAT